MALVSQYKGPAGCMEVRTNSAVLASQVYICIAIAIYMYLAIWNSASVAVYSQLPSYIAIN